MINLNKCLFEKLGSICILFLFTAFSNETVIITVSNLSFTTYKSLENIYSTTLQCPCANKTISQEIFLSFSPRFHQICSSGFVDDQWITLLKYRATISTDTDWFKKASAQFQLLTDLCDLANQTITNAVQRFYQQTFVTSSIMDETDFNKQINASVNQFYQSTLYNFNIQKDIVYLILQVDQFYMASPISGTSISYVDLIFNTINITDNSTTGYVCSVFQ